MNDVVFCKGTLATFKRSVVAEVVGDEILTVVPHGSRALIKSILPVHVEVVLPDGEKLEIRLHEPRRLGEILDVLSTPPIGKIL